MRPVTEKVNGTKPQTLADLSLEQLKAMAYDQLALIQAHQANLQALSQEIQKRGKVSTAAP